MKYRTKLFVTVLLTVVVTNGIPLAAIYHVASRSLFDEIGNNALSIAATTAAFVDGDEHKAIQMPGDEKKEEFNRIKQTLKRVRDANQRDDTWVENLYTMKSLVGVPNELAYGVDSEERTEKVSAVNKPVRVLEGRIPVLGQREVDRDGYSADEDGTWLSANVPLKDRSGNLVAAVGVDFPKSSVEAKFDRLREVTLLVLGLIIVLAAIVGFEFSRRAVKPVRSLCHAMESMGVSRQELDRICTGMPLSVQTERRRVTVLFSDIREFTRMSENMRPEDVANLLNEYFQKMVEVVVRHEGFIDKFIGDGLMALFGAPHDDRFQEEHAVNAALDMQRELCKLSDKWAKEGRPPLRIGIGINSGNAIVGNLGSEQRLEYTAIGDTINLASRLESLTKEFGVDILISEYTFNALRGAPFEMTRKGPASVEGRSDSVIVYAVAAKAEPAPRHLTASA